MHLKLKKVIVTTERNWDASYGGRKGANFHQNFSAELWDCDAILDAPVLVGHVICHSDNEDDIEYRASSKIQMNRLMRYASHNAPIAGGYISLAYHPKYWLNQHIQKMVVKFINDPDFKSHKHKNCTYAW